MASKLWPIRGSAYTFRITGVYSQADPTTFKTNPTLAAADFRIMKDGGAWAALTNTPTVLNTDTGIEVVLTATEMTADEINVRWQDAAGAEWIAGERTIYTAANGVDSVSTYAGGAVASVTAGVTVTTNNDKTGYALTAAYDAAKTAAQEPQGIKKNTALNAFTFPIFDPTDHLTPKTGLAVTATRSLDGAAFAGCANAVSEIGATGYYKIDLAAADLNGEIVVLKFTATGGDPQTLTIRTVT